MAITRNDVARSGVVYTNNRKAGFAFFDVRNVKTIILDATESAPLLHKDEALLRNYTSEIIKGLSQAAALTGATNIIVAVNERLSETAAKLSEPLPTGVRLCSVPDVYPTGDENLLLYFTLGLLLEPGTTLESVGVAILDVETAFNLGNLERTPVVAKHVDIVGAVKNPCTLCVPLGVTLEDCLEQAGGATVPNPAYIENDVMTGRLLPDLDLPVGKTTSALVVLPDDHIIVKRKTDDLNQTIRHARAVCNQCARCTELCPRYIMGNPTEPHRAMNALLIGASKNADAAGNAYCSQCNLCSYYSCPEGLDPMRVLLGWHLSNASLLKSLFPNPVFVPERASLYAASRLTSTKRLLQRLQLDQYDSNATLCHNEVHPEQVIISLGQTSDTPALPLVQAGDAVSRGQTIAIRKRPADSDTVETGADLHSSIDGTVVKTTPTEIIVSATFQPNVIETSR